MTRDELAEVLQLKENYIRTHWSKIVRVYSHKGMTLYKEGRGDDSRYGIEFQDEPGVIYFDMEKIKEEL